MTEEKRIRKKSNKKKYIIFGFIGILVGTMMVSGLLSSNYQNPVNPNAISYEPYTVFSAVDPACYVTYINQNNTKDPRATVILYDETKNDIQQTFPGINMTKFLTLEGTKLYLFQHCKFINDRNGAKLPTHFNMTLGQDLPKDIQAEVYQEVQMAQADKTPIAEFAKTNSIESIGTYYFLSYEDAVQILMNQKIMTVSNDCMPYGFTKNSTEYMCVWNGSSFGYDTKHFNIQPFQYDQRLTSIEKLKELSKDASSTGVVPEKST